MHNSVCVCVSDSPCLAWPCGRRSEIPTTPWMHSSACGSLMLPGGAGLCPASHSQIYTRLEKRFPSNWSCLMKQVPKWNQTVLKKKSSERKFTWAGWPIPGSWKDVLARLEEVNAKENGQRSVGVTKKQCGHERESSFSRASPDHHLDLSTSCLLYQVKAKQVWMSPASMDPCWSPLLVDGHRQAKRELTDRQV